MSDKGIVEHIIVVLLFVIITFFLWVNFFDKISNNNYDNRDIAISFDGFGELPSISDKYYEKLKTTNLNLRNIDKINRDYKLYFIYSKKSTVDYKTIKLDLNNNIYDLSKIEYEEDDDNYYFHIIDGSLEPYTDINLPVRIWTSVDSGKLTSSFMVK